MSDRNLYNIKDKIKRLLTQGIEIEVIACDLNCTPSSLKEWLNSNNGKGDHPLTHTVYSFIKLNKIKNVILDFPFFSTDSYEFIDDIFIEAKIRPAIYILIGSHGIGKTYSSRICYENHEMVKLIYKPEEFNIMNDFYHYNIFCIDNADSIKPQTTELLNELIDNGKSAILLATTDLIKKPYPKISSKSLLYHIPGLSKQNIHDIFNTISLPFTDRAKTLIELETSPCLAKLLILIQETYKLMQLNNLKEITYTLVLEGRKVLSNYPKWQS